MLLYQMCFLVVFLDFFTFSLNIFPWKFKIAVWFCKLPAFHFTLNTNWTLDPAVSIKVWCCPKPKKTGKKRRQYPRVKSYSITIKTKFLVFTAKKRDRSNYGNSKNSAFNFHLQIRCRVKSNFNNASVVEQTVVTLLLSVF